MVRAEGLEPPHLAILEPKSSASTSSATRARPQIAAHTPIQRTGENRKRAYSKDKRAGKPLHRQNKRKAGAPPHTVVLPEFGVEAFTALLGETGPDGPVFASRTGGWMSLANMRRALRTALPEDLRWVTPHSFRRTVATLVRDDHGPALAQQQLSHAKLATTEAHYLQRQTHGPDVRVTLDKFAGQDGGG